MKIDNELIKQKIQEKQELIKKGKDTTIIDNEIREYTKNYIETTESTIKSIVDEVDELSNDFKENKKIDKKSYNRLIELYRQSFNLTKNISEFKKEIREYKKVNQ